MIKHNCTSLQKVELEMLKAIDDISKKLGIQYFMLGGTLLGAIRHQGFIPWDDDIDIGMLREDYEKFIKEAQDLLPTYYFVQTYQTDPEFYLPFAKIRDSRTTFIETVSANHKINHGVYIDIFPIDFYKKPSKTEKIKRLLLTARTLREVDLKIFNRNLKNKILSLLSLLIFPNAYQACDKLDKLNSRYNSGEKRTNYCGAWGNKEIVDSDIFNKSKNYYFEGFSFTGPEDSDSYLRHIYGDYMKLPPKEKRISHHFTDVIDLTKSYTHYIQSEKRL